MRKFLVVTVFILLEACISADILVGKDADTLVTALIMGSAEYPDPVLKRVRELERKGSVEDVMVQESFPLQIHLKATQCAIEELNNIPRMKGRLY